MLINRLGGGGGEDLTPEVNINTERINEIMEMVVGKANPQGKYLWSKYKTENSQKGEFIGYAVSDEETKYPENGIHADGLWYKKTTADIDLSGLGVTRSSFGSFTLDIDTEVSILYEIQHDLEVIPKFACIYTESDLTKWNGSSRGYIVDEIFYNFSETSSVNQERKIFFNAVQEDQTISPLMYRGVCSYRVNESLTTDRIYMRTPYGAVGYTGDFSKRYWYLKRGITYKWFALA